MQKLPNVIAAYIEAYNRKDVDAMLACLADDVAFQNFTEGKLTAEAKDKKAFGKMAQFGAQAFSVRKQTVTNTITVSDTTLAEIDYEATVAADLPNGWKSGQELSLRGASLFQVRDGKIVTIVDEA